MFRKITHASDLDDFSHTNIDEIVVNSDIHILILHYI
jgi:hypothetical protein